MDRKRVNLLMVNILALVVAYLCAIVMQKQEFFFQAFPYILSADSFFVCYKLRNYKTLLIYAILIVIPLSNQWLHWNPNFGGFWPGGRGWYRTSRPLALLLAVFHESKNDSVIRRINLKRKGFIEPNEAQSKCAYCK